MQHLSEKWLKLLNYYYIFASSVLFSLYIYAAYQEKTLLVSQHDAWGVSIVSAAVAAACIIYNFTLLKPVRKFNVWLAYLISILLVTLANSAAVEVSLLTPGSYVFLLHNILFTLTSTAFGPVIALSALGLGGIVYIMELTGSTTPTRLGLLGDSISIAFRATATLFILYVLRNKYVVDEDKKNVNYIERYFVDNEVVKLLTDSISDGVIIIDQNGIVKSINPGATKLLKHDRKDILDLDYRSVLKLKTLQHQDLTPETEPVGSALKLNKAVNLELLLVTDEINETFIDINVSPIANKDTSQLYGAVIILRDVTQKKKEEAARSEFISTASHEMRTPVAAIEGYLALALNPNVSTVDAKARGFLEKAHMSTEHLGRLFQDLLISAKAEDGRLVSHPSIVEMSSFLEQLVEDLRLITAKRGLELEFITGSPDNPDSHAGSIKVIQPLYYAYADPDRLREVITNLFDNAVKYTIAGKITIGLTANAEVVQFFVRDTGAGIPPDDVPHLFQKFYRVDNTATRTTGGTGLGLFICRKILELYGGRIWVESEWAKGSTFFVNLPRISSAKAATMKGQVPTPEAAPVKATTPTQ